MSYSDTITKADLENILNAVLPTPKPGPIGYGTGVGIESYDSNNKYTVPSDGIVRIACTYRSNSYIQLFMENGTVLLQASSPGSQNAAGNNIMSVPVYKGMKVYIYRNSTYSAATFYPYIFS